MARYLYVDDNPSSAEQALRAQLDPDLEVVDMSDPEWSRHLARVAPDCDVVISDYRLDENEAGSQEPLYPLDGVAANSLIRSLERRAPDRKKIHTLLSGGYVDSVQGFDLSDDPQIRALQLDADWSGTKDDVKGFCRQIKVIGAALEVFPDNVITEEVLRSVLGLSSTVWSDRAWEDVVRFAPPLGAKESGAVETVRWLSATAIAFPSFLIDSTQAALRVGASPEWFRSQPQFESQDCGLYCGALSGLSGPRWWRAGLDDWLWKLTEGNPLASASIKGALTRFTHKPVELLESTHVEVHDVLGAPTGEIVPIGQAVRFIPLFWPSAAGFAWTTSRRARTQKRLKERLLPEGL